MDNTTERERQAFYEQMAPGFFEYLRSHMSSIEQVELAVTREGIVSFPAIQELGGVRKTVRVPLTLLTMEFDTQLALMEAKAEYAKVQGDYAKAQAAEFYQVAVYAGEQGDYAKAQGNDIRATKNVIIGWFNPFRDVVENWATDAAAAESLRASEELLRCQSELVRVNAESERKIAELQRVYVENLRQAAFLDMQAAELSRARAELDRVDAELLRQEDERERQEDDSLRHSLINRAVASSFEAAAYAKDQGDRAKAFNDNPWRIGDDGYIYTWDETVDNGDGSFGAMVRSNKLIIGFDDLSDEQQLSMIDLFFGNLVVVSVEDADAIWDDYEFKTND